MTYNCLRRPPPTHMQLLELVPAWAELSTEAQTTAMLMMAEGPPSDTRAKDSPTERFEHLFEHARYHAKQLLTREDYKEWMYLPPTSTWAMMGDIKGELEELVQRGEFAPLHGSNPTATHAFVLLALAQAYDIYLRRQG